MDGKLSAERMSEASKVRIAGRVRWLTEAPEVPEVQRADGKIVLAEDLSLSHGLSFNCMTHAKHRLSSLDFPPPSTHISHFKCTVPGS